MTESRETHLHGRVAYLDVDNSRIYVRQIEGVAPVIGFYGQDFESVTEAKNFTVALARAIEIGEEWQTSTKP